MAKHNPDPPIYDQTDFQKWFEKGDHLFQLATSNLGLSDVIHVGMPAGRRLSTEGYESTEFAHVKLMLHSFAVECWLKGLILREATNRSQHLRDAKAMNEERWNQKRELTEILESLDGEHSRAQSEIHDRYHLHEQELKDSYGKNHKIRDLAAKAGVQISDDLASVLTGANKAGRYPMTPAAEALHEPWRKKFAEILEDIRKDIIPEDLKRFYEQIHQRYVELGGWR